MRTIDAADIPPFNPSINASDPVKTSHLHKNRHGASGSLALQVLSQRNTFHVR